jgi:hypothetical protein
MDTRIDLLSTAFVFAGVLMVGPAVYLFFRVLLATQDEDEESQE